MTSEQLGYWAGGGSTGHLDNWTPLPTRPRVNWTPPNSTHYQVDTLQSGHLDNSTPYQLDTLPIQHLDNWPQGQLNTFLCQHPTNSTPFQLTQCQLNTCQVDTLQTGHKVNWTPFKMQAACGASQFTNSKYFFETPTLRLVELLR